MADWFVFVLLVVAAYGAVMVAIFLHEAGHAVAAWAFGWKVLEIRIGSGRVVKSVSLGDLEIVWRFDPFAGLSRILLTDASRWKLLIVALSGPLVTLAIWVGLWKICSTFTAETPWWLTSVAICLLVAGGFSLLYSLVPHRPTLDGVVGANDMLQAIQTLTVKREELERRVERSVVDAAQIYARRGQTKRGQMLIENHVQNRRGTDLLISRIVGIHFLLAMGETEEARLAKEEMLNLKNTGDESQVAVLDSLSSLPIYYGHSEMLEECLGYIDQAILLDPEEITLKGTKNALLIELGRWEEGLALIEEVEAKTQSNHDREMASYYRALAILKSGDRTKAGQLLQEAVGTYPGCRVRPRLEKLFCSEPA